MKKWNNYIILTILVLIFPIIGLAQPDGFNDFTGDAPVDGGLSLLIAAGVGYGIKRMKENSAKQRKS